MKKIYVSLFMGIFLLGLTGCGNLTPDNMAAVEASAEATGQAPSGQQPTPAPLPLPGYSPNSITVNSSEKVAVVPDIAEITYSVRTQAGTAADCQQQNAQSVNQVIALLESLGIAESSIQTSGYHMNPVYNYSGSTPRLTGYEADTTLTVSDIPIEGLGNILSQSVANGINTVQSITYMASKYDESYQAALTAAVESARQKAQALAGAAGQQIGAVIKIQETSGYSQARYSDAALTNGYRSASMKAEALMEDMAGIMPGEIQVEASIVVEYQLY